MFNTLEEKQIPIIKILITLNKVLKMLFYILDNDDKHTFLGGIEEYAVYVEPSSNLMLNRSNNEEAQSLGYGDYQIASQTSIQNILNALNDLQYEDCLVVVANDNMDFDWYPLNVVRVRDPYTNAEVPIDTQERMDLRQLLMDALNNQHFMYGI